MSKGIDIKFVKQRYENMPDDELIRIATQDAAGLTAEAMEVVKAEIRKRNLGENLIKGVEAQNKEYSLEELDAYCDLVSKLDCPKCGSTGERLNATLTSEVMSFIFFTTYNQKIKVGCPTCLDKENNKALLKTAILGWWGIPWGLIRTPIALVRNIKSMRTNHLDQHKDNLRSFVLGTVGELESHKNDNNQLRQILSRQNAL